MSDKSIIGGSAALYASLFVQMLHPFDVIKTRLQSHDGQSIGNVVPKYGGILGAIKGIYREEGLRGFTKGIFVSFFANGSSRALFFSFYEQRKDYFIEKYGSGSKTAVLLASIQAGFSASLITQPIWQIYTRVQLNTKKQISGIQNFIGTSSQIYNQYGLLGFYRGFFLSLILSLNMIVQINIYELIMKVTKKFRMANNQQMSLMDPFFGGLISKAIAIYLIYPITTIRTRVQQNQFFDGRSQPKYSNARDVVKKVIAQEGVRGFYKGIYASLLKGMPAKGIYFLFYEQMKNNLNKANPQ